MSESHELQSCNSFLYVIYTKEESRSEAPPFLLSFTKRLHYLKLNAVSLFLPYGKISKISVKLLIR